MRKPLVVLAALVMTAGLLGASTASSSAASSKISVRSSVKAPWPGEATKLTGRVTPKKRVVELQKRRGKKWVRVSRTKTRSGGAFAFSVRATTTRTSYRVVARKTKIKRKVYKKKLSKTLYVKAASPKVSLSLYPAAVRVSPMRAGVPVVVQRKIGSAWSNVVNTKLPASGLIEFPVASNVTDYRAGVRAPGATTWTYSSQARSSRKLAWSEEFSDPSTLGTTWRTRDEATYHGKRMCSATSPKNSYVLKGHLRLKVTADNNPDPALVDIEKCKTVGGGTVLQGMVGTQLSHAKFKYGTFAARIKFQAPRGMHGGFWLQSAGVPEIDVAEYFGDGRPRGGLTHYLHDRPKGTSTDWVRVGTESLKAKELLTHGRNTPSTGFHVYSVDRTTAGYVFRVDGVETFRTTQLRSEDEHYLVLSLVSSDEDRKNYLDKSKLPQAFMDVDWVRVWK
ncbi:hypothetical protein AFL01nite_14460 [Aeromicrobium flavum]|uniref:GH16 domain-containing protein n=1 Tax=Aeromicrobium flavum TaxID=416568 RepID=A0A512HUJ0_9ACTN|nr:glycoside hydrolase family 16 protein [Aeromicrobium flavum]GEO89119.1 hypothetical protein AFL01nite_14460 [Aeromicrobium flavum]